MTTLPASILAFEDFRKVFPNGKVLSRNTGYARDYGLNPYRNYDQIGKRPFLFRGQPDARLPALAGVLCLLVADRAMAYPRRKLPAVSPLNTQIESTPIVIFSQGESRSALDAQHIGSSRMVPVATASNRRLYDRGLQFRRQSENIVDDQTESIWKLLGHAVDGPLKGQ